MLVTLLANRVCRFGLAQLLADIIDGRLPEEAKQYLLSSHLIPLPKDDNRIRPISIGEIFYRVAAYIAIDSISEVIGTVLSPIQLGVGIKGGIERAIHKIRHLLTRMHN